MDRISDQLDKKYYPMNMSTKPMGGFFTGAFVGMVSIDYSGYDLPAVLIILIIGKSKVNRTVWSLQE